MGHNCSAVKAGQGQVNFRGYTLLCLVIDITLMLNKCLFSMTDVIA